MLGQTPSEVSTIEKCAKLCSDDISCKSFEWALRADPNSFGPGPQCSTYAEYDPGTGEPSPTRDPIHGSHVDRYCSSSRDVPPPAHVCTLKRRPRSSRATSRKQRRLAKSGVRSRMGSRGRAQRRRPAAPRIDSITGGRGLPHARRSRTAGASRRPRLDDDRSRWTRLDESGRSSGANASSTSTRPSRTACATRRWSKSRRSTTRKPVSSLVDERYMADCAVTRKKKSWTMRWTGCARYGPSFRDRHSSSALRSKAC